MGEVTNKVAVVTGAGRGIGRAISLRLAQAGAQLVLAGRNQSALAETAQLIIAAKSEDVLIPLICHLDLLDQVSIDALAEKVLAEFGRIDILVNNSGIAGKSAPLWELKPDEWDETIDTNLKGPYLISRAFIPAMIGAKSGTIIFIGSITGKRPLINRSVYAASKLGLLGLMRTLALELGSHGIRVNLISPGFVKGPRIHWVLDALAKAENMTVEAMDAQVHKMIPLGEFVSPENVAEGVLFFAGDRSAGITGEDLNISGGLVMY
jgi:NAD(P)-dependent dehydrogenase (short-subunit alcohol dehydrogenase family)